MATTNLPISDLDFDDLRNALKTSLQNNPLFRDYNWEGSALSILLDVLAHDSYYKSYYLNVQFNEAFLDSALLRGPLVSAAKELDYTPQTARAPSAFLDVNLVPYSYQTTFVTIPRGTRFQGTYNNNNYTFATDQDYTINSNANGFFSGTIEVLEGDFITQTFTVVPYTGTLILPIYNTNVDERSLSVAVFPSAQSTTQTLWTRATDILQVTGTSTIWFLQEGMSGLFELQFGDGILGAAPQSGNVIQVSYRACNATAANGCKFFTQMDLVPSVAQMTISLNQAAAGGSDAETIESIRYNAPRNYDKQNRNVTENDYLQSIISQFGGIQSISVWGGEKNTIPAYGKVFVCVKPTDGFTITDTEKATIAAAIQPSNIMAIDTVFVDATFNYIVPQVNLWYNSQATSLSASQILSGVSTTVQTFESQTLGAFNNTFYFSRFTSAIDATDPSILGNDCRLLLQKRFTPQLNSSATYTVDFHQQLVHPYDGYIGTVSSSAFRVPLYLSPVYIDDDGSGNLRLYYTSGTQRIYVSPTGSGSANIGTVNYATGLLTFTLPIASVSQGTEVQINVVPLLRDIAPVRNEILLITQCSINVWDQISGLLVTSGNVNTAGDVTTLEQNAFATAILV